MSIRDTSLSRCESIFSIAMWMSSGLRRFATSTGYIARAKELGRQSLLGSFHSTGERFDSILTGDLDGKWKADTEQETCVEIGCNIILWEFLSFKTSFFLLKRIDLIIFLLKRIDLMLKIYFGIAFDFLLVQAIGWVLIRLPWWNDLMARGVP